MNSNKDKKLEVRVSPEFYGQLVTAAAANDQTVSKFVRTVLDEAVAGTNATAAVKGSKYREDIDPHHVRED